MAQRVFSPKKSCANVQHQARGRSSSGPWLTAKPCLGSKKSRQTRSPAVPSSKRSQGHQECRHGGGYAAGQGFHVFLRRLTNQSSWCVVFDRLDRRMRLTAPRRHLRSTTSRRTGAREERRQKKNAMMHVFGGDARDSTITPQHNTRTDYVSPLTYDWGSMARRTTVPPCRDLMQDIAAFIKKEWPSSDGSFGKPGGTPGPP